MAAHDGASTSSSSSVSSFNHDVFLSFRGEDTRNNFTGFLYEALKNEGIDVFIDSEGLWAGEEIQTALYHAIRQSKISIPVFSKGYADSKWCLMELVEILRCHKSNNQTVLPIFLDVEPRDVRHQTGSFGVSFQKHMESKRYEAQKIQSWKDALREVAEKKGFELKQVNGYQPDLVKLVVDRVSSELSSNHLSDVKNPVGLDDRVEDVLSRLKIDSNDVRFLGICGIGGMGKTTIAKTLYNHIFKSFEMNCFLANVREEASAGPNGVVSLQEKLLYSVSTKEVKVPNFHRGQQLIKEKLQGKKVLLILDDVDSHSQLKHLAIEPILFGPGSRIIITTRDEHILNVAGVNGDGVYRPKELDDEQSLKLFSLHAFSSDKPPKEYLQLSLDAVHLGGGRLPLALVVLGSIFSDKENREEEVWKSMLQELKRMPHEDVYKSLKLSYDNLKDNEKSIFLDGACFFVGWKKEKIIQIWDACGFNPTSAIQKLTQMSLLKFETSLKFWEPYDVLRMHDQIQAMGRRIVNEESPTEPHKRSRLWDPEEILEAIKEPKGAQMLEGITMKWKDFDPYVNLHEKHFETMSKLRFLIFEQEPKDGYFDDFAHLPPNLRWFSWPGLIVPTNFYHKKLVYMDLRDSRIGEAWTTKPQNKNLLFQNLKVLLLRFCDLSSKSLDFSWFPYLERLDLSRTHTVKVHKSIGDLKSLVELDLGWTQIEELPNSICSLSSLKVLNLDVCESLKNLPKSIGDLKSLVELDLQWTKIEELPNSICSLSSLKVLNLHECGSLKNLPESIGDLKSLVELDLRWTKIEELPNSICSLSSLKVLNLDVCESLKNLPKSIGDLKSLVELDLRWTKIEELPNSICSLSSLKVLNLHVCGSLKNLPESIGDLKSLVELGLSETKIEKLPNSICSLSSLKVLDLEECSSFKNLPESIGDLKSLVKLDLRGTEIKELPNSICSLSSLKDLTLKGCRSLKNLPNSFGDLKALVRLDLGGTEIEEIPSSICKLNKLPDLNSSVIEEVSDGVWSFEKLEELEVRNCHNLVKLPISWGRMRCLRRLDLSGTKILLARDDSEILLPSLEEFIIGNNLESSFPPWISRLPRLQDLELHRCTKLESIPDLPSTLKSLSVFNCISLQTLPDLSSLKHLRSLRLDGCKELKEIRGIGGTEYLHELEVSNCETLTNTARWKIHGQGKLLVDEESWGIDNYTLDVYDGIHKGIILCVVVKFRENVPDTVQEGELVDISLEIRSEIHPSQKHSGISCVHEVVIKGVEYTASTRDIIYVHHSKGFDWFGIHLEPGIATIQLYSVWGTINPHNHIVNEHDFEVHRRKFLVKSKLFFESTAFEQQQQITNQEEEESARRMMVANFFKWSDDDEEQVGSSTDEGSSDKRPRLDMDEAAPSGA